MTVLGSEPPRAEVSPDGASDPTPPVEDWDPGEPGVWARPLTWLIVAMCLIAVVGTYFLVAGSGFAAAAGGCGGG